MTSQCLIGKWLNAGVMEDGHVYRPDSGTPQGGVISPLLANVYLHEVLDEWFECQVKPRLKGRAVLIRYADDFVIVFEREEDARRVLDVLPKRFGKYNLRLHPEKTRLVPFRRPPRRRVPRGPDHRRPGTFNLLGFTHFWCRSRKGFWVVLRKTETSRLSRALKGISLWLRQNRHEPIRRQHRALVKKVSGHYAYYGVTGNYLALDSFRYWVRVLWCKWLSRRSNTSGGMQAMNVLLEAYPLPRPVISHAI